MSLQKKEQVRAAAIEAAVKCGDRLQTNKKWL